MNLLPEKPLLNRMLEKWIQHGVKNIIPHYQYGFNWGITDWFNIRKSIIIFYHTNSLEENHISIDVESV